MAEALPPPDQVTVLQDEVAQLKAKLDRREAWKARARRAARAFLLVAGCGLVAGSLVAAYTRATVLNTDRYVETMAPIARSPAVQAAVVDKLSTAINERVDFNSLIAEALPERAEGIAPAITAGLQTVIRREINDFVTSPRFPELWDEANRRVHDRVIALLTTGQSKRLLLEGDTVVLDLSPTVERVRQGLQERGFDRLAAAIPPSVDGQITLLQSEGFVKARNAIDLLEALTIVLPILALLCLGGHVFLSRPRRRGLLRVGLGLAVTALLLFAAVGLARSAYLDAINQAVLPRQAAADIFDALIEFMRLLLRIVAIAAVVIALVALVLGRAGAIADRSRKAFAAAVASPRTSWLAEHRAAVQWTIAGLGGLVLLTWDPPTAGVVLSIAAIVAVAIALVAAIARAAPGGPPPAEPAVPEA